MRKTPTTSENKRKTIKAILWSKTNEKKVNEKEHMKNVIEKVKFDYEDMKL